MRRNAPKGKPKGINTKIARKAIVLALAVVATVAFFVALDTGKLSSQKSIIDPPVREIGEREDPGLIKEFSLKIEKLNIEAPIIANVDGREKAVYNEALNEGVAHYKNTGLPSSGSNVVLFAHSSTVWGVGKYSNIFASLGKLIEGDEINVKLNGKDFFYKVEKKEIVSNNDLEIIKPTQKEQLTLLTCWPVGTARQRLVVVAKPVE